MIASWVRVAEQTNLREDMDKWRGKVALVTGAGAGIGAAIASQLVHQGMVVVGLDVDQDSVQKVAKELAIAGCSETFHPLKADLRKEEDIVSAFKWIDETLGGADVLVNNAGVMFANLLSDGVTEEWRHILDVNVLAVSLCTREYLQSMRRRQNEHGHIIMINAVAAHTSSVLFPRGVMYIASKHAVKAVAMCLRRELADRNSTIKVTGISPGRTRTGLGSGKGPEGAQTVAMLEPTDIASAVLDILSASAVTQICEIIMTPVPTKLTIY